MGDVQKHDPSSIAEIVSQIKLRYRLSDEGVEDECFIKLEEFLTDKNIIKIIFLKCRVFRLSKIDLIIGRPSIKLHGFANISSSHFGKSEPDMPMTTIVSTPTPNILKRKINNTPAWVTPSEHILAAEQGKVSIPISPLSSDTAKLAEVGFNDSHQRVTSMCKCCPGPVNSHLAGVDTTVVENVCAVRRHQPKRWTRRD